MDLVTPFPRMPEEAGRGSQIVPRRAAFLLATAVLGALAAQLFGASPTVASAAGTQVANVEALCPPATPGTAQCLALRRTDVAAPPGSAVSPLATTGYYPARILDSRSDTGFSGPLATSVAQTFAVTGQGSVPSAATAVTGNLTVTEQDAPATSNRPGGYGCPDQLYAQLPAQR